jgi:DNA repair protein RadC
MAARELVRRALAETMRERDMLASPAAVRDYLRIMLAQRDHEVFMVLFLDAQNRVIAPEEMFRGTLTQTSVYPREVVKRALSLNAAAVILAHNHPSGVAEPSRADEFLTQSLRSALALVDIRVLDHIVRRTRPVVAREPCATAVALPIRIGILRSGSSPQRGCASPHGGGRFRNFSGASP